MNFISFGDYCHVLKAVGCVIELIVIVVIPVRHNCHSDSQCPPCTELTQKYCMGEHEIRRNIPCHLQDISCGLPCKKSLQCGRHTCLQICHKVSCHIELVHLSDRISDVNFPKIFPKICKFGRTFLKIHCRPTNVLTDIQKIQKGVSDSG